MRLSGKTLLSLGVCTVTLAGCQYLPLRDSGQVPPATAVVEVTAPVPPAPVQPLEETVPAPALAPAPVPVAEISPPAEPAITESVPEPEVEMLSAQPPAVTPLPEPVAPTPPEPAVAVVPQPGEVVLPALVESLCQEIGGKLGSVSVQDCLRQQLQLADGMSINQRPLVKRDFLPQDGAPVSR